MAEGSGREWVGTPLERDDVDSHSIAEIVVEFDEGEEVLTPRQRESFGSYEIYEAAAYIGFLAGHIVSGREG